jgi:dGTPase
VAEAPQAASDYRNPGERDRDRVLHAAAFRRLAGITQVATSEVSISLHNRLTHVLEVAQIGRRLAQHLMRRRGGQAIADEVGGIDPDIVEMACLAHDLGHPPFGHLAEEVLDDMARRHDVPDGFEGNAQSFRVVTKLAVRGSTSRGLNLTRAGLNALLKYPWMRATTGKKSRKWGAYSTEQKEFEWARTLHPGSERKSAEAEIMDWADDIAYSVHDMEDFFKAGKIPLDRLVRDRRERKEFCRSVFKNWQQRGEHEGDNHKDYEHAFDTLLGHGTFAVDRPFNGTRSQLEKLRDLASVLITNYADAIQLRRPKNPSDPCVIIDEGARLEITMLKELTWQYVIRDPSLATQQHGQRRIVQELFEMFLWATADPARYDLLPVSSLEQFSDREAALRHGHEDRVRVVLDLIAGMSEQQAVELHHRLQGITPGSSLRAILL